MKNRFISFIASLALAVFGITVFATPGHAARIYNELAVSIRVCAGLDLYAREIPTRDCIIIAAGARSESISWPEATSVQVEEWRDPDATIFCKFDYGNRSQMQGGNYAVIKNVGGAQPQSCTIFDSNHVVLETGMIPQ